MRILSRYLLKQHVPPFLFAFGALTSFMLLNQIAKRFGDLVGKGLPWSVIVEFFVLTLPYLIALTLPMAVLVAVLFAFSRLVADNEFTAVRAGGVSLGQLVTPVLVAGAGMALIAFFFLDHVLPRTNHQLRTLQMDIGRKKPTLVLKEQVVNVVRRNSFFLRALRIDAGSGRLEGVTIYDLSDPDRKRIIYADSGEMAFSPDLEDLWLTLYAGTMHEFDRTDPKMFQQMTFAEDIVRVAGVGNELRRTVVDPYKGSREMSVCEMDPVVRSAEREQVVAKHALEAAELNSLRSMVNLVPLSADTAVAEAPPSLYCRALARYAAWLLPQELRLKLAAASTPAPVRPAPHDVPVTSVVPLVPPRQATPQRRDSLPSALIRQFNQPARQTVLTGQMPSPRLAEFRAMEDRAHNAELRAASYLVEVHKKYAIATACIVFVLVGVPVALRFPRGGIGIVVGASVAVFAVYYIGLIAGESLANRLYVPPALAMWSSNIIFTIAGVLGLWWSRTARQRLRLGTWRRASAGAS